MSFEFLAPLGLTDEDSFNSTVGDVGTDEGAVTSWCPWDWRGLKSFQLLVPLRLMRVNSFRLLVPLGLAGTQLFQPLVPGGRGLPSD